MATQHEARPAERRRPWIHVLGLTWVDREPLGDLVRRSSRLGSLVSWLVLHRGTADATTERAARELWGHLGAAGSARELGRAVGRVQHALAEAGGALTRHDGRLVLEVPAGAVDAERFEAGLAAAWRLVPTTPEVALDRCVEVVALWSDERAYASLEGLPAAVAEAGRLGARRAGAEALRDGLRLLLDPDVMLVADLEARLAAEPDDELTHRQLAAALAATGRTAEAVAVLAARRRNGRRSAAPTDDLERALLVGEGVRPEWILPPRPVVLTG